MKSSAWLWLGVGGAFALLLAAWTAMFFFAGRAQVQTVPLVAPAETRVKTETGWNALTPTCRLGDRARPDRVERLEVKSLHPEEAH